MNERIVEVFEKLKALREFQGDEYRARAYANAIQVIKDYPKPILAGIQVAHLRGIGKSLVSKIDEIIRTGTVSDLSQTEELEEMRQVLKLFESVERVGPETAKKWYAAGYRQLSDIPREATNEGQWVGIQLYPELQQRIPRDEIVEFEQRLHQCLDPLGIQFEIAGSYRRGRPDSGDIDILVIDKPGMNILNTVVACPGFVYRFAQGPKKFLGLMNIRGIHRRVDVELVQPNEYPFAITYFTGSQGFNIKMREYAAQHGLRLNEKGLFGPNGESYPATSEKNLFEILGLQYLTPQERDKY